ncbi:uncharacterized protein [Epargyreus clarus]|uniref:uncharacterized protein n=1 Tax=Epargyreus clarus TaxID=520877 RepID=UPI003C2DC3F7
MRKGGKKVGININKTKMEGLHLETSHCREMPRQFRGNVNITCDTILWNKYKLMKYDNVDSIFDSNNSDPHIIDPEFAVEKVLLYNTNMLCLDSTGNININTIIHSDSEYGSTFTISKTNVIACELINKDVLCFEIIKHCTQLYVHEFNETFRTIKMYKFSHPDSIWATAPRGKNIICIHHIEPNEWRRNIGLVFDVKDSCWGHLVVMCLDKTNVYACVLTQTESPNLRVVKLYQSQSEIVGINISKEQEICLLVGLSSGNIVNVSLSGDVSQVIHLNTALYKFVAMKNTLIYTDGLTMWKIEDIFTKSDLNPEQFFVKNVSDFCVVSNKVICTTFSNLIYCFYINDKWCYISSNESEGQLMTNLGKIMCVTKENEKLIENINKEKEYLLALSLSNRPNVMDDFIQITSDVYENYNDLEREIKELTLTDSRNAYYDTKLYYVVIKISATPIQHKLNKLLSNVLGDIKIHITIFAERVLKTTSIIINEQLKKKNFVIPLKRKEIADKKEIQVTVKIVTNIPGKMDEKQRQWSTLYSKTIKLNAENFIRSTYSTNNTSLKEDDVPLEKLICDIATHLHGAQYNFDLSDNHDV